MIRNFGDHAAKRVDVPSKGPHRNCRPSLVGRTLSLSSQRYGNIAGMVLIIFGAIMIAAAAVRFVTTAKAIDSQVVRRQSHISAQSTVINIGMTIHAPKYFKTDQSNHRWIVRFAFRHNDENQRQVIENLGLMAHEVVRIWLEAITPGARVSEPRGEPIGYVTFPTRSTARRFIHAWGGSMTTTC